MFRRVWHSPHRIPAELTTLRPVPNRAQERSNPAPALQPGSSGRSRGRPQGVRGGMASKAKALLEWSGYADRRPMDGHVQLLSRAQTS
jgi:hypothetical protein